MHNKRIYPFIAGLSDFFFVEFVLASLTFFGFTITYRPISLFFLFAVPLIALMVVILYYTTISNKLLWLSPGEQLTGRIIQNKVKTWTNPYGVNRWILFLAIFITLAQVEHSWDQFLNGYIYTFGEATSITLQVYLVSLGLILMGKGKLWGAILPISVYGFGFFNILSANIQTPGLKFMALTILGGIVVLNGATVLIYYFLGKKRREL